MVPDEKAPLEDIMHDLRQEGGAIGHQKGKESWDSKQESTSLERPGDLVWSEYSTGGGNCLEKSVPLVVVWT